MHQTTIRFAPQTWRDLEREARSLSISAAQYVRDATVAQLAYGAGRAGALAETNGGASLKAHADVASDVSLDSLVGAEVLAQAQLARARAYDEEGREVDLRSQPPGRVGTRQRRLTSPTTR
jgi:hypothetical protein